MRPKLGLSQRLIQLGVLILILVAWYIGTMPGHINPLLLPPPAPVFQDFWHAAHEQQHLARSLGDGA